MELAAEPGPGTVAAIAGRENPAHRAQALLNLANINIQQTQIEAALEYLTQAYEIGNTLEDAEIDNSVLKSMANVYYSTGQYEQAKRYYSELVALDQAVGNTSSLAVSLFNLGHVTASLKMYAEADLIFQRSLSLSSELGDDSGRAFSLKALGVNAQAQQDFSAASAYLIRALSGFQAVNDSEQIATVHRHLGDIALEELRPEAAIGHYEEALPALAASSFNTALMRTYRGLSSAYEQLGDYEKVFINYRAYTQLLQHQLEQQSRQTTQRMQAQFQTQRLTSDNENLELLSQSQQQELQHRQDLLHFQYLAIILALALILLTAVLWLRSRQHASHMQLLATTDELTGLLNRRAITEFATHEWQRSRRFDLPFCCLVIDIDHFKAINDNWGHRAGDQVLKDVSTAAKSTLRQIDALGRFGGEEFLVVAPETSLDKAEILAQRIRTKIETLKLERLNGNSITVSIGIAQMTDESSLDDLIGHADEALYEAKDEGRNRVMIFGGAQACLAQAC